MPTKSSSLKDKLGNHKFIATIIWTILQAYMVTEQVFALAIETSTFFFRLQNKQLVLSVTRFCNCISTGRLQGRGSK